MRLPDSRSSRSTCRAVACEIPEQSLLPYRLDIFSRWANDIKNNLSPGEFPREQAILCRVCQWAVSIEKCFFQQMWL